MGDVPAQAPTAPVSPTPQATSAATPTPEAPVAQQPTALPSLISEKAEPEVKAEVEDKKPEDKKEPPAIDAKAFKLPDGFEIDEKYMGEFTGVLKDLGLNQEGGQKLLNLYSTLATEAAERSSKLWNETNDSWVKEVKADKEIGGDNLLKVKSTVSKALDAFGSQKVRDALDMTGAGNHPEIIRFVYKMAEKLTEGGFVSGGPGTRPRTAAEAIYGRTET